MHKSNHKMIKELKLRNKIIETLQEIENYISIKRPKTQRP